MEVEEYLGRSGRYRRLRSEPQGDVLVVARLSPVTSIIGG